MMLKFLILALCLHSVAAFSGIIKTSAKYFKTTGSVAQFQWAPASYNNSFRYDIVYYIPAGIKNLENTPALIFMHGGGDSTVTRQGSMNAVNLYMNDIGQKLANDLKMPVIIPSATGLNWGGHTNTFLRELARLTRTELNIDSNRMALAGHSMGGMGITRAHPLLVDEFSFMMPLSAGMDVAIQNEERLNKSFDIPYVHIQGLTDHFDIFVDRCREQEKRMKDLEVQYGYKSLFEMIYYNGAHNYDYALVLQTMKRLYQNPRNIFRNRLHGLLVTTNNTVTENNITYHQNSMDRYFWVKVQDYDNSKPESINFHAQVKNNIIDLNLIQKPTQMKTLRLFLSKKLVDLDHPVEINLNGQHYKTYQPTIKSLSTDVTDVAYQFEDFVDVNIQ